MVVRDAVVTMQRADGWDDLRGEAASNSMRGAGSDGCMDALIDESMHKRMDAWMDGWMDACMDG
eukprot:354001-Chlamydomonas_euryale.AAC.9